MPKQIFISSVQKEFAKERKFLKDFIEGNPILRRFFSVFAFEYSVPATDATTQRMYMKALEESDIYLCLIGNDYGFEDAEGISPTEREFDEATRLGIPRLVLVKGEKDNMRHPKEKTFLGKISPERIRRRYNTQEELLEEIYSSLDWILAQRKGYNLLPFDAAICERAKLSEISSDKLNWFRDCAIELRGWKVASNASIQTVLTKLHLLDENGQLSNAALLLFGKDPQKYFPYATIKCMHFHGTKVTKPIPSYHIYEGNLFDMIDNAVDFILGKIDCTIISSETKVQGKSVYEIPAKVVKEAIVNGCAHRDYTSNGSVQVMLFKDRLEVLSPGELPDKISIPQLSQMHESVPVNPLIANPLYLTRYAENAGSGTTDMIELCKKAGLPPPEYVQELGCLHAIIRRNIDSGNRLVSNMLDIGNGGGNGGENGGGNGGVNGTGNGTKNGTGNGTENGTENGTKNGTENGRKVKISTGKVLAYIIKHPGCQTPEIEKALGIPLRTLRRYLQVLREDCIEYRGAYTNGGYYVKK